VQALLDIPLPWRLAVLAVLGAVLGGAVNLAVDRLAWEPRRRSPWAPEPDDTAPRRWTDRIPVIGWLGMRRESALHGRGFWLRGMLLEIACAAGLPTLYWWEVVRAGLLPPELPPPVGVAALSMLHAQFLAHALLGLLMLTASMIDIDEKIIPDSITIPGTLLGLLLAATWPKSLLPALIIPPGAILPNGFWQAGVMVGWPFLHVAAPNDWPGWLDGWPRAGSLAIGLACWWAWCLALMPRRWRARHGHGRALALLLARWRRLWETRVMLVGGMLGTVAIAALWTLGPMAWRGLLTALVGLAAGGGIIWVVRIVGSVTLRREAMGFGDVTLMAMIGTLIGWQGVLMVFFLAPLAGLAVGLVQVVVSRDVEIPYGPFLCLATLVVIVAWAPLWAWGWAIFAMGWLLVGILTFCMVLMGLMLAAWMLIRRAIGL
jgi:prepilin signal peptidase PulO-like enzyme (type II secretory pathway)